MAIPTASERRSEPVRPPARDPLAIRACLTSEVAAIFDSEWKMVLEEAKGIPDLSPIHDLLDTWRHIAYGELIDPGRYFRTLATASHILATGRPRAGAISGDELRTRLQSMINGHQ